MNLMNLMNLMTCCCPVRSLVLCVLGAALLVIKPQECPRQRTATGPQNYVIFCFDLNGGGYPQPNGISMVFHLCFPLSLRVFPYQQMLFWWDFLRSGGTSCGVFRVTVLQWGFWSRGVVDGKHMVKDRKMRAG